MPFIGLSPFLLKEEWDYGNNQWCVNALYRAFSISTNGDESMTFKVSTECQCPLSGFLHFYIMEKLVWERLLDVSMPFIGLSPFLHSLAMDIMTSVCCVNALYRAFSISTYCPRCGSFNDHYECQCPLSGFFHFYAPLWERPKMKHLQTRFCR